MRKILSVLALVAMCWHPLSWSEEAAQTNKQGNKVKSSSGWTYSLLQIPKQAARFESVSPDGKKNSVPFQPGFSLAAVIEPYYHYGLDLKTLAVVSKGGSDFILAKVGLGDYECRQFNYAVFRHNYEANTLQSFTNLGTCFEPDQFYVDLTDVERDGRTVPGFKLVVGFKNGSQETRTGAISNVKRGALP